MDAHTPSTHMPGYSKARLKRIIAAGNVAAMAIALWSIFLSTWLYAPILSISVLLPLCALALDIRTRGALGFEARRGRRYPLSLATIVVCPALALGMRAILDLNFASYPPLILAAVLTAIATFLLFWRFDPQLRGDRNQSATIAIFALPYCFGVLAFADVVLDPSSGHETQTVIRDRRIHVSGGVKGSSVVSSKSIRTPPLQAPTGSVSSPISGTRFTAATPSACTLALDSSACAGTPSSIAWIESDKPKTDRYKISSPACGVTSDVAPG